MPGASETARAAGPDPTRVTDTDGLVRELDLLRRRAAYGTSKARIGLADLARLSEVPRSTVHTYVNGMRTPPADVLDRIVVALGATGPEQAAWADALDRVAVAGVPTPSADEDPVREAPRDLPPAPGVLVGRTAELTALDSLGDTRRLAVLTGGGGMGKSALALHWAHREATRFPDGQLHIDLQGFGPRPARAGFDALASLLRALGVEPHTIASGLDDRIDQWAERTRGRRLLVLLDNASDAAQVTPLIPPSSTVTTLVTSRDDLTELVIVQDAVPVPVAPLDQADVDELIALAVRDDRAGDDRDAAWLAEAMRRCAGMPLALRIISERWLRGLSASAAPRSPQELLDEMGLRSTDLGVRTTLGWTLDHLTPQARQVFRRIGAIPQAVVDEDLVAAVAGTPVREARLALESLAAVHLVTPTRAGFTMHDLVSAFARERYLAEEPAVDRAAVEDDLSRHVAGLAQAACRILGWESPVAEDLGPGGFEDPDAARRWLDRHLDTVVAVASDDRVAPDQRWVTAAALGRRHQFFDPSFAVDDILRDACVSARRHGHDRALGMLENLLGVSHAIRGEYGAAHRHMTVAVRRYERAEWPWGLEAARTNLAKLAGRTGYHDQAMSVFAELLAERPLAEEGLRLSMAELWMELGDLDSAREHATWVLEHQPTPRAHSSLPTAHHFLAQIHALSGRPQRARAVLTRAPLDEARAEPMIVADRIATELYIAVAEGRFDDAAAHGRRVLRSMEHGDAHGTSWALLDLADVELCRDDVEAAAVWLSQARLVAEPLGLHHWTMQAMLRGARLSHRLGDHDAARDELLELTALARACGSTPVHRLALQLADELSIDLGRL